MNQENNNNNGNNNYNQVQREDYNHNFYKNYLSSWNWGASFNGIFWAIANRTYLPLLAFVPFVGFFWWIICGLKGTEWAWRAAQEKNMYNNFEEFMAVQKSWNRAGIASLIFSCVGIAFVVFFYVIIIALVLSFSNAIGYY